MTPDLHRPRPGPAPGTAPPPSPSRLRSRPVRPGRPVRRVRPVGLLAAGLALALTAGACSSSTPEAGPPATDAGPTTTAVVPGPLPDQTPPTGTFGVDFHDNQLWVADFYQGEILAVDPDSGSILRRLRSEDNVAGEVDNIAVGDDGTVYWAGYNDGAVGRVTTSNVGQVMTALSTGIIGLALSPDGKTLYVGGSMTGPAPLQALDPLSTEKPPPIRTDLSIRAFTVGPDGMIYGPRFGGATPTDGPGALLQVDPATGVEREVAALDGGIAADMSADGRSVYVLSQLPGAAPALRAVELATGQVTAMPSPKTPLAANLTVAPDGRIFVTSYNQAQVSVISADGNVKLLTIGQPAPKN